MKELKLYGKNGGVALVDDQDFEECSKYRWCKAEAVKGYFYVVATVKGKYTYLHRFIMKPSSRKEHIDHINGDRLDNRRENLRKCEEWQNQANTKGHKVRRGEYKGVFRHPNGKIMSQLRHKGKDYYLGYFKTPEDAARAYDKKSVELKGEFANLNFPPVEA